MRTLTLLATTALLLAGCGATPQAGVPQHLTLSGQAGARTTLAAKRSPAQATAPGRTPLTALAGGWVMNDGFLMNDDERRVWDALPGALKPTPTTSKMYRNLVSNFDVRVHPGARFWSFSGVRLVSESLFVPENPSFEWFFTGVFDTETGEMSIYREVLMATHPPRNAR